MSGQVNVGVDPQQTSLTSFSESKHGYLLLGIVVVLMIVLMCSCKSEHFNPGPETNYVPLMPEQFAEGGFEGLRQYEMADPGAYLVNQSDVKDNPSENLLWAQVHMI